MKIKKYKIKNHKKTDLRFNTLIECLEFLIDYLKTWKGTPVEIAIIEDKVKEIKESFCVIDPLLEKIMNPAIGLTLNGYHNIKTTAQ